MGWRYPPAPFLRRCPSGAWRMDGPNRFASFWARVDKRRPGSFSFFRLSAISQCGEPFSFLSVSGDKRYSRCHHLLHMQEAKKLSVNIVTWNHQAYLPGLFDSLDAQDATDFTVTVVDNASNDGTVRWLQDQRPDVTVLRNFRNQGTARARNQAIAFALSRWPEETWSSHYILFASPDVEFAPDTLRVLVAAMDADPSLAVCGPKVLRAIFRAGMDDEHRETEKTTVIESTGLQLTKARNPKQRGAREEDRGQYDSAIDVFGFSGACFLIRASVLAQAKIGDEWFDEDFVDEFDDVDFAWRLRRIGYSSRFVPSAIVWRHDPGPSRKKADIAVTARNRLWLCWKNDEWANRFVHLPWIIPFSFARGFLGILSFPRFKAGCTAWFHLFHMQKKRKQIEERVSVRGKDMRRWFV